MPSATAPLLRWMAAPAACRPPAGAQYARETQLAAASFPWRNMRRGCTGGCGRGLIGHPPRAGWWHRHPGYLRRAGNAQRQRPVAGKASAAPLATWPAPAVATTPCPARALRARGCPPAMAGGSPAAMAGGMPCISDAWAKPKAICTGAGTTGSPRLGMPGRNSADAAFNAVLEALGDSISMPGFALPGSRHSTGPSISSKMHSVARPWTGTLA